MAPILLALVLVVSGVAKLVNLSTAQDAFVSLRLPTFLVRLRAPQILPFAEIVLAIALLVTSGPLAVLVAVAALCVFVAYLVVIVRALGFDESVTCSCFGKLGLGAVDRFTAVRNAILVALAVLTLVDATHGHSVVHRMSQFNGGQWLWLGGVLAAIILTWLIAGDRGDDAPTAAPNHSAGDTDEYLRAPIPFGRLRRPDNETVTFRALARSEAVLLLYVSPTCGSCVQVIEKARTWQRETDAVHTYLVLPMAPTSTPHGLADPEDFDLLFDPESEMYNLFQTGTPTAILLGADGYLAGGPVVGFEPVAELLDDILAQLGEDTEETGAVSEAGREPVPAAAHTPDGSGESGTELRPVAGQTATPSTTGGAILEPVPVAAPPVVDDADTEYLRHPTPYGLLERPDGTAVPLISLADAAPTVLLFVSPSCSPCQTVIRATPTWRTALGPIPVAFVVGDASALPLLENLIPGEVGDVYIDPQARVNQTFAAGNPGMVALGPDRLLLAGPVTGSTNIEQAMEEIIEQVTGQPAPDLAGTEAGEAPQRSYERQLVPDIELQRRDGTAVNLSRPGRDRQQLLAFLSPGCEACEAMADQIPTWRAQLPEVDIVVVAYGDSSADSEPARSFGDALFDTTGGFGEELGILTPALMLVGKDGTIAGGPVSGLVQCQEFVVRVRGMYATHVSG